MKSMYDSRFAPALNTPVPNAAYVDDSSSQNESLQRKADMANGAVQRVVQRETGVVQRVDPPEFPIEEFVYKDPQNGDLIFEEGHIVFTKYEPNLVSSGFTGCLMMSFKFKKSYKCNKSPNGTMKVENGVPYIAHVFCHSAVEKDTKKALVDAEQQNLISIEALFKPWTDDDAGKASSYVRNENFGQIGVDIRGLEMRKESLEKSKKKFYNFLRRGKIEKKINHTMQSLNEKIRLRDEKRGKLVNAICFTGSLFFDEKRGWKGNVYTPNVNVDGTEYDVYENIKTDYAVNGREDGKKKLKSFSVEEMNLQTFATKAFVYASVIARKDKGNNINVTAKDNDVKINAKKLDSDAWNYLEDFASADKKIIQRAMSLVKENSKEHKILKASTINE